VIRLHASNTLPLLSTPFGETLFDIIFLRVYVLALEWSSYEAQTISKMNKTGQYKPESGIPTGIDQLLGSSGFPLHSGVLLGTEASLVVALILFSR
jgi:hypothetical protein